MKQHPVALGFFLFLVAYAASVIYVVPVLASTLLQFLGFLGTWASPIAAGIITFPILVFVLWLSKKGGAKAEIPDSD